MSRDTPARRSDDGTAPVLVWIRREMRLADNPALRAAADSGRPVIPVFIREPLVDALGAAPKYRLGLALAHFAERLEGIGSRLVLRSGQALAVLKALADETGAAAIHYTRRYGSEGPEADRAVERWAEGQGIAFCGHDALLLLPPGRVLTGQGETYKVFTPFWKAARQIDPAAPVAAVQKLRAPDRWPESEPLDRWRMGAAMNRGADVVGRWVRVGEERALRRLHDFLREEVQDYAKNRDMVAEGATSGLSEPLSYGEISARTIWHEARSALDRGTRGTDGFLRELYWRDFAWNLYDATPQIDRRNWRDAWDDFPWKRDNAAARDWRRARTGQDFVDAGMREMFVTGRMHNRVRMVVASFLTKNLLTDWRVGLKWFEQCLSDWDPASNALNWQWVAGSGPDSAPYFRVFNPATQAQKFDPDGAYRRRWLAEGQKSPTQTALSYFDAVPRGWKIAPDDPPPPVPDLKAGRQAALDAYRDWHG